MPYKVTHKSYPWKITPSPTISFPPLSGSQKSPHKTVGSHQKFFQTIPQIILRVFGLQCQHAKIWSLWVLRSQSRYPTYRKGVILGGLFTHDQLLESKSSQGLLCLFQLSPLRVKKSVHWCDSNPKVIKKDTNFTRKSVFLLIFDQHRIFQSKSASWKRFMNFNHRATCKKLEKSYGPVLRSVKIS